MQFFIVMDFGGLKFYIFFKGIFVGIDNVLILVIGYIGVGGLEFYVSVDKVVEFWNVVMEVGESFDIKFIGLGVRDILWLEMGYCFYGNDIDDIIFLIEVGFGWIIKMKKGEFISCDIFIKQWEEGVSCCLVGFEFFDECCVFCNGYFIVDEEGIIIGQVILGMLFLLFGYFIGMGYVKEVYKVLGMIIYV